MKEEAIKIVEVCELVGFSCPHVSPKNISGNLRTPGVEITDTRDK